MTGNPPAASCSRAAIVLLLLHTIRLVGHENGLEVNQQHEGGKQCLIHEEGLDTMFKGLNTGTGYWDWLLGLVQGFFLLSIILSNTRGNEPSLD